MTPEQRLERQADLARKGFRIVRADSSRREATRRWLEAHPTSTVEADELWRRCLDGEGPLARWLEADAPLAAWREALPLRVLLSSHPFPDVHLWLMTRS
jgi:hypothetical protein